VTKKIHVLTLA